MMESIRPLRDRAHVVCVECHARKVKCDLQERPDGSCTNCRRVNHMCIRRDGVRKKRKSARRTQDRSAAHAVSPSADIPHCHSRPLSQPVSVPSVTSEPRGFISPSVVMNCQASPPELAQASACLLPADVRLSILDPTGAAVLPRPAMLQALKDMYFQHAHPFCPVVDECDLEGPDTSVMLQQAVCLVGGLMQHGAEMVQFCCSQYQKVKTLIFLNQEEDNVALLKTFCLLTSFSIIPTDQVTLDGPWHWSGMASRLAIQMGLHRSFSYDQHANPVCLRRIFWQLINANRMAASCWGRPSTFLHLRGCDVPPLAETDFPSTGRRARVFMETVKLSELFETITDINLCQKRIVADDAKKLVEDLCGWIENLPEDLQLYDRNGTRRTFWRPSAELHIMYFVAIILAQLLDRVDFPWKISASSLTAASCIAKLYEEIYFREETARLFQVHGFFCMAAAVPLIYYSRTSTDMSTICQEDINLICRVLESVRHRYGGADLVLRKITKLQEEMKRDGEFVPFVCPDSHSMPASTSIQKHVHELFPFPRTFCGELSVSSQDVEYVGESGQASMERELGLLFSDNYFNLFEVMSMECPVFDANGNGGAVGIGLGESHEGTSAS